MNDSEKKLLDQLLADTRLTDSRWVAYIMATTRHETNNTFEPVQEAYWLSDEWRRANLRYYPWHGRGFVQITWEENYKRLSHRLNIPELATDPTSALDWGVAYEILVVGMIEGLFTGRDLGDYINDDYCDYLRARRIVNGMDKARLIANYAKDYEKLIKAAEPKAVEIHECTSRVLYLRSKPVYDDCVVKLQGALNLWRVQKGIMVPQLLIDGKFGSDTKSRVKHFQDIKDLLADGIVGQDTWAALRPYL
jgi:peptidoglycan hydrolase-like protein with peptidoglycan-binding domain